MKTYYFIQALNGEPETNPETFYWSWKEGFVRDITKRALFERKGTADHVITTILKKAPNLFKYLQSSKFTINEN